jgi:hypothetical protein
MTGFVGQEPTAFGDDIPVTDEAVVAYARGRGISEVLHFTTDSGLIGVAATGALQARDLLNEEQYLEHIYQPNCPDRSRDARWTDHVSMSITKINGYMLGKSKNWHREANVWWCVLAFDVAILGHPGVTFADSNNAYPATKRDVGLNGLTALFADTVVWGNFNTIKRRTRTTPLNMPTQEQAEVLYPRQVPLRWLRNIYVPDEETIDYVGSLRSVLPDFPAVPVVYKPEVFA